MIGYQHFWRDGQTKLVRTLVSFFWKKTAGDFLTRQRRSTILDHTLHCGVLSLLGWSKGVLLLLLLFPKMDQRKIISMGTLLRRLPRKQL